MIEANAIVETETVEEPFDFEKHRVTAVEDYRKIRGIYERFSEYESKKAYFQIRRLH